MEGARIVPTNEVVGSPRPDPEQGTLEKVALMTSRTQQFSFRRLPLAAATALLVLATAAPLPASESADKLLGFWVMRDEEPIGVHKLKFSQVGEETHVEIEIDLKVGIGFITLFRYEHRNREVWRDGRLVALDSRTNDDGDDYWVKVRATDEGLSVEHQDGSYLAPAGTLSTSYWNKATVGQSRLIDTQKGRLLEVAVAPNGEESLALESGIVPARRYEMTGDLNLSLWYGPQDELMRIAFEARGADIDYDRWSANARAQAAAKH